MNGKPSIFFWIPIFVFLPCTRSYNIPRVLTNTTQRGWPPDTSITYLGVSLDFEPPVAEMALATERKDGCRVICADFLLLCIITNTHANMVVACSTADVGRGHSYICIVLTTRYWKAIQSEWLGCLGPISGRDLPTHVFLKRSEKGEYEAELESLGAGCVPRALFKLPWEGS